jgi:hypothetical protein
VPHDIIGCQRSAGAAAGPGRTPPGSCLTPADSTASAAGGGDSEFGDSEPEDRGRHVTAAQAAAAEPGRRGGQA